MKAALVGFRVRPLAMFGVAMILVASGAQPLLAERPRVDAAALGFSPTAAAAANVAAFQRAVDGGSKLVTVTTPGVYDLDATVWLDSNTRLECSPGRHLPQDEQIQLCAGQPWHPDPRME